MNLTKATSRTFAITCLCIISILSFGAPSNAKNDGEGNIEDKGVTGTWTRHEETGVWTAAEVGLAPDRNGYYFELECFAGGDGYIDCLRGIEDKCNQAPDGRSVWWYSGLLETPIEDWPRLEGGPWCVYSVNPYVIEEIEARITTEFQERPISPSGIVVQPNPHSLVGMENNMYALPEEQIFDMTLLEQNIRIVAKPTEFEWHYGDGSSYGPISFAGAPLTPEQMGEATATSYAYSSTGNFPISVTTYFSGTYSINGGPMISIEGRAEVDSPAQTLSVWKAESRSVADNCLVNPAGFGC
jgi:hypothetical protein